MMLNFQTLSCLHDIPVVRSSTNKLHDVYAKAKDASVLIRLPCNLAETIADKTLKIALTVANPMQGKFQMHVVPKSGHAVHEDAPEQVADCIASFLVRHKLVQANDEHFQATLPGC
ncbi:unnamed protein product [Rotaria sp. Silwood1]|nr:unnamed protein product [Rotaria sp. Silwood1]